MARLMLLAEWTPSTSPIRIDDFLEEEIPRTPIHTPLEMLTPPTSPTMIEFSSPIQLPTTSPALSPIRAGHCYRHRHRSSSHHHRVRCFNY